MNAIEIRADRVRRGCPYRPIRSAIGLSILSIFLVTTVVQAQLTYPWNVGCAQPIMDEFGSPLEGITGQGGDRVEMIIASNGVVDPPAVDGSPSTGNHLFYTTTIGNLVSPNMVDSGLFSISLFSSPRYSDKVFIRVFNAPTREEASFYADSQLGQPGEYFRVTMGAMQPLDPADDDGDGLNNSWEKSLGSDPLLTDTDGDGMSDQAEFKARTDPTDPESNLRMAGVRFDLEGNAIVSWHSAPSVSYQIEVAGGGLKQGGLFAGIGQIVTATDSWTEMTIPADAFGDEGLFRIRLAE